MTSLWKFFVHYRGLLRGTAIFISILGALLLVAVFVRLVFTLEDRKRILESLRERYEKPIAGAHHFLEAEGEKSAAALTAEALHWSLRFLVKPWC